MSRGVEFSHVNHSTFNLSSLQPSDSRRLTPPFIAEHQEGANCLQEASTPPKVARYAPCHPTWLKRPPVPHVPDCIHNISKKTQEKPMSDQHGPRIPHAPQLSLRCSKCVRHTGNSPTTPENVVSRAKSRIHALLRPPYLHTTPNGSVTPEERPSPPEEHLSWLKSPYPTNTTYPTAGTMPPP
ncbi:hypothetical protein PAXINDRAFT_22243 [Paxillus involutus ATCC 200175]|uniref:Unplaced genomic scaffold PAXINscaffold_2483, whole genome shotgun sequence n=1 Tax=Paxillus involutus ATCC 200175 TaxID=664439 RepID=A0A0C9SZC7_PAXIN|nr:hypothetical protein PAXINDRAFT_22243 [Paxillus involutus ATCC 200175]